MVLCKHWHTLAGAVSKYRHIDNLPTRIVRIVNRQKDPAAYTVFDLRVGDEDKDKCIMTTDRANLGRILHSLKLATTVFLYEPMETVSDIHEFAQHCASIVDKPMLIATVSHNEERFKTYRRRPGYRCWMVECPSHQEILAMAETQRLDLDRVKELERKFGPFPRIIFDVDNLHQPLEHLSDTLNQKQRVTEVQRNCEQLVYIMQDPNIFIVSKTQRDLPIHAVSFYVMRYKVLDAQFRTAITIPTSRSVAHQLLKSANNDVMTAMHKALWSRFRHLGEEPPKLLLSGYWDMFEVYVFRTLTSPKDCFSLHFEPVVVQEFDRPSPGPIVHALADKLPDLYGYKDGGGSITNFSQMKAEHVYFPDDSTFPVVDLIVKVDNDTCILVQVTLANNHAKAPGTFKSMLDKVFPQGLPQHLHLVYAVRPVVLEHAKRRVHGRHPPRVWKSFVWKSDTTDDRTFEALQRMKVTLATLRDS